MALWSRSGLYLHHVTVDLQNNRDSSFGPAVETKELFLSIMLSMKCTTAKLLAAAALLPSADHCITLNKSSSHGETHFRKYQRLLSAGHCSQDTGHCDNEGHDALAVMPFIHVLAFGLAKLNILSPLLLAYPTV